MINIVAEQRKQICNEYIKDKRNFMEDKYIKGQRYKVIVAEKDKI